MKLEQYLEKRIEELERLAPLLQLYGVRNNILADQISIHRSTLEGLRTGRNKEEIIKSVHNAAKRTNRIYCSDIIHCLEHGEPQIPESLYELPAFVKAEARRQFNEKTTKLEIIRKQAEDMREKRDSEARRKQQEEIAERLGIRDLLVNKL